MQTSIESAEPADVAAQQPSCEVWNIDNEAYHAEQDHDSSTTIKLYLEDPLTYFLCRVAKTEPMQHPGPGPVNLGSAFEIALLEPERYEEVVAVTKCGYKSAGFRDFVAELEPGQIAITEDDALKVRPMVESVKQNPEAWNLCEAPGDVQLSLKFACLETGIRLKVRYDKLCDDGRIVQVKTSRDPMPWAFGKQVHDLRYHVAEALYRQARVIAVDFGVLALGDERDYLYLVVQNEPPFECLVHRLSPRAVKLGFAELRKALAEISNFRAFYGTDKPWHTSYHGQVNEIDLPGYAYAGLKLEDE